MCCAAGKGLLDPVFGRQQGRPPPQRIVTAQALLNVLHLCADSLLHCAGGVCCQGLRSNGKPVVVLGDLNCAHQEIDVYAPKKFTRAAGFTQVGCEGSNHTPLQGRVWCVTAAAGSVQVTLQLAWSMLRLLFQTCAWFTCCPVLQEERDSFGSEILRGAGLVDAWRAQHPGVVGYTYYSFRGPNGGMRVQGKGWRLDYTLVRSAQGRELAVLV